MALNFTLLTENQIWGDEKGFGQLDVMDKYGIEAAPTDLTLLLGGIMTGSNYYTSERELTCKFWSASSYRNESVSCVTFNGSMICSVPHQREFSVRPALPAVETAYLTPSKPKIGANGVRIVEYGEYPQMVADTSTTQQLERLYRSDSLKETGKSYTFASTSSINWVNHSPSSQPLICPEYELDGQKYIRIFGKPADDDSKLSNGEQVKDGKSYWVRVEPIEWLKDPTGIWVSKKCLFAGIQFDTRKEYWGNFSKTSMKHYLDTYFAKEIEPSVKGDREMLKNLSRKLAEINDLGKLKEKITPARTLERTEQLARIMRVRKAKAILSEAARKAQKSGDKDTLQEIVKIAKPYAAREAAIRNKLYQKRLEYRARSGRE